MFGPAIFAAIVAFFRAMFGRKAKDPELEVTQNALAAKTEEVRTMEAPGRDKRAVVERMRGRADG